MSKIETGIPFFSHMLEAWSKHGLMDLAVDAKGDLEVDLHHTVEDVGLALGRALDEALGDKKGIVRFGTAFVPMDETLVQASVDLSGRPYLVFNVPLQRAKLGSFDLDLLVEFFRAFATEAKMNLHVTMHYGANLHHVAEAVFKAVGRALAEATRVNPAHRGHPALHQGRPVIAIVDYGRGNLASVQRAFARVDVPAVVTQEARVVDDADAVVIPGDGAFHDAMGSLEALGLVPALHRALDGTRPFLGICLGYQLLFSTSEEFGEGRGLDVIPGRVRRFPPGPRSRTWAGTA